MIDWQDTPHYYGAFKLNYPGQDVLNQRLYYQFLDDDTNIYLAGDSISFSGGWIEGALQTGMNAAAAVVHSIVQPVYMTITLLMVNVQEGSVLNTIAGLNRGYEIWQRIYIGAAMASICIGGSYNHERRDKTVLYDFLHSFLKICLRCVRSRLADM